MAGALAGSRSGWFRMNLTIRGFAPAAVVTISFSSRCVHWSASALAMTLTIACASPTPAPAKSTQLFPIPTIKAWKVPTTGKAATSASWSSRRLIAIRHLHAQVLLRAVLFHQSQDRPERNPLIPLRITLEIRIAGVVQGDQFQILVQARRA